MKGFAFLFCLFVFGVAEGKVYDCFMFNNEYEILEIRLNELNDYVDKFVIVESNHTHFDGQKKPFRFEANKKHYEKFLDKIIYVKVEDSLSAPNGWARENWERNQIMRGLKECDPDDLILISDADEFIPGQLIEKVYEYSRRFQIIAFRHKMYRFFLNRAAPLRLGKKQPQHFRKQMLWAGLGAIRYKYLVNKSPQEVRNIARSEVGCMFNAGWHFTSMGGYERVNEKYESIVEGGPRSRLAPHGWRGQANAHPLVPIDESFPLFVQNNIDYLISLGMIDTSKVES